MIASINRHQKRLFLFKNNKGESLIQVMVSVAIMSIIAAAFASMFESQQKQIKFLESKQDVVDIKNILTRILNTDPGYCPLAVTALGDITFSTTNLSNPIAFNKIYDSPTNAYLDKSTKLASSNLLEIDKMEILDLKSVNASKYTAKIEITLKHIRNGMITLKPITFSSLDIDTASVSATVKRITGCTSIGGNGDFQNIVVEDLTGATPCLASNALGRTPVCTYPITNTNYRFIEITSKCSSQCKATDGHVRVSLMNGTTVLYQTFACFVGGVAGGNTNTNRTTVLYNRMKNATHVRVDLLTCDATTTARAVTKY